MLIDLQGGTWCGKWHNHLLQVTSLAIIPSCPAYCVLIGGIESSRLLWRTCWKRRVWIKPPMSSSQAAQVKATFGYNACNCHLSQLGDCLSISTLTLWVHWSLQVLNTGPFLMQGTSSIILWHQHTDTLHAGISWTSLMWRVSLHSSKERRCVSFEVRILFL